MKLKANFTLRLRLNLEVNLRILLGTVRLVSYTTNIIVNERIKAEVVREAFRRLESSRNKTSADGLKKAFEQSQNCIRSHLELNQYKTFLESQFYKSGSHLPPIDEDKVVCRGFAGFLPGLAHLPNFF